MLHTPWVRHLLCLSFFCSFHTLHPNLKKRGSNVVRISLIICHLFTKRQPDHRNHWLRVLWDLQPDGNGSPKASRARIQQHRTKLLIQTPTYSIWTHRSSSVLSLTTRRHPDRKCRTGGLHLTWVSAGCTTLRGWMAKWTRLQHTVKEAAWPLQHMRVKPPANVVTGHHVFLMLLRQAKSPLGQCLYTKTCCYLFLDSSCCMTNFSCLHLNSWRFIFHI